VTPTSRSAPYRDDLNEPRQASAPGRRELGPAMMCRGIAAPTPVRRIDSAVCIDVISPLIDEYEFVVQPRLAGHGPTLFAGLSKRIEPA
jgi:hypothetical protein